MKKILDLGCGRDKYKGGRNDEVIGIDIDPKSDADTIYDLNKFPYPFDDNEFDMVYSNNLLGHLLPQNKLRVLKEIYRICKPNGIVRIIVPHVSHISAISHPNRMSAWSLYSFFNKAVYTKNTKIIRAPRFEILKAKLIWSDTPKLKSLSRIIDFFANLNPYLCERVWCYWVGGFNMLDITLKVKK